jgi:hypothetical protein
MRLISPMSLNLLPVRVEGRRGVGVAGVGDTRVPCTQPVFRWSHRLDLQSLFGFLCTAVLIG